MREQRALLLELHDDIHYVSHTDPESAIPHTRVALVIQSTRMQCYRARLIAVLTEEMARIRKEEQR